MDSDIYLIDRVRDPLDDIDIVASDDAPDRSSRRTIALYSTVIAVLAGFVLYVHTGYFYGYNDHTLLSIKGIGWADSSAFRNDWFNNRAPQPHWFFDVVTWFGEATGHLPAVYFVYWLATLAAFGVGTAWLALHWLPPERRPLALVVPLLAAVGPFFALGTFLPLAAQALPNLLGGCLAYAVVAALITGRRKTACVLAVVTGIVHVQHGVVVAGVLVLVALFDTVPWRQRIPYVGTAFFLVVMSGVVSTLRGLASGNADMLDACKVASIGHCNANAWAWPVARDGLLIVGLGAAVALMRPREWRVLIPVLVIPAAIDMLGYLADRGDWGSLGEFAQRLFVYRLGMLLAPFVPWLVVLLAASAERRMGTAVVRMFAAGAVCSFWVGAAFNRLAPVIVDAHTLHVFGFLLGVFVALPMFVSTVASAANWRTVARRATAPVVAVCLAVLPILVLSQHAVAELHPGWIDVGYRDGDGNVAIGKALEARLPVGSVLAHPPDLEWVRLLSRRAVVGNCRAAPYGGPPWFEYKERLAALGVDTNRIYECYRSGYEALTLDQIVELRDRFGATHAAFLGSDPKVAEAQDAGWTLLWYSGPGTEPWWVFEIPER